MDMDANKISKELCGCVLCHGTGMAAYVDIVKVMVILPAGNYTLGELTDKYGDIGKCPNGCEVLN